MDPCIAGAVSSSAHGNSSRSDISELIQLVDKDGAYENAAFENLCKQINLAQFGVSYKIVARIGPQSSGKSTLFKNLLPITLTQMIYRVSKVLIRSQTTKGIWLGYHKEFTPGTLVMDIEGSDGSERGEDDTKFVKQTALFALAVADVVLINIWCTEIGREKASMNSLLKVVFEVMRSLYNPRKITLLFVIHDKSRAPLHVLDSQLRSIIRKIWNSIPIKEFETRSDINKFFNVEVVALSHYTYAKEEFIGEVCELREQISGLEIMDDDGGRVPASALAESLKTIWEGIQANKDIDIPHHKVILAACKCDEIRAEKLKSFLENENWDELRMQAQRGCVDGLGAILGNLIKKCLFSFDEATRHFDKNVKSVKRKQLEVELLLSARDVYKFSMVHTRFEILSQFKKAAVKLKDGEKFVKDANALTQSALQQFDEASADAKPEQAIWNSHTIRNQLKNDIDGHVVGLISSQLPAILKKHEEIMKVEIVNYPRTLLREGKDGTWNEIRGYFETQSESVLEHYHLTVSDFDVDPRMLKLSGLFLKEFSEGLVKESARVESENALNLMVVRFFEVFFKDSKLSNSSENRIRLLTEASQSQSVTLLSVLAVIRLDERVSSSFVDVLKSSLAGSSSNTEQLNRLQNWTGVDAEHVLLTPPQCLQLWKDFIQKTSFSLRERETIKSSDKTKQMVSYVISALFYQDSELSFFRSSLPPMDPSIAGISKKHEVTTPGLLLEGTSDTWNKIREHFETRSKSVLENYRLALSDFDVHTRMLELCVLDLKEFGEGLVKEIARVESENALNHMVDRDLSNSSEDCIRRLTEESCFKCVQLLSVLAVIQLDESVSNSFRAELYSRLLGDSSTRRQLNRLQNWRGVDAQHVLLKPPECLDLWEGFIQKISYHLKARTTTISHSFTMEWGEAIVKLVPTVVGCLGAV